MIRPFCTASLSVLLLLAVASPSAVAKPKKATAAATSNNSPVVTPDTTPAPAGTASPSGSVQMSAPGAAPQTAYAVPVGGAQATAPAAAAPAATATVAAVPAAAAVQGPPEPPVMVRAEQCLRVNVERVSRAEPSPKLAVDLLLADVCASEVDAASLYARNVEALARFNPESERGRAGLSTAHVDPDTGQIVAPSNVDVSSAVDAAENEAIEIAPTLRKYAAELVLIEKARAAAPSKKAH